MAEDMRGVIAPKSDQLNSDDLIAGPITITIEKVTIRDAGEQPISVHYVGDKGKPFKPGKSMARVMVYAWGAESKNYVGRSMTLYRDPKVTWAGMAVGGIRISHMSHIGGTMEMALRATKGISKLFTVQQLQERPPQHQKAAATEFQPSPESDGPDPRETWVNQMIEWMGNQTELRLVEGLEKKKANDIEMLPVELRSAFDSALAKAKERIGRGAGS